MIVSKKPEKSPFWSSRDRLTQHSLELCYAFGFLYPAEVIAMQTIARALPKEAVVVNIGAGAGTSALAILEARPDLTSRFWTVDISPSGPYGGLENERNAFDGAGMVAPNQILGDSKDIGVTWTMGEIDLLFIDGDHSYDGCMGDIVSWIDKIKPGGYVLIHDYDRDVWPEVKRASDDGMIWFWPVGNIDTLAIYRKPL